MMWLPHFRNSAGYKLLRRSSRSTMSSVYNHPPVELNTIRLSLFKASTKGNPLRGLPQSPDALLRHIRQAGFGATHCLTIWGNTLSDNLSECPSSFPEGWGMGTAWHVVEERTLVTTWSNNTIPGQLGPRYYQLLSTLANVWIVKAKCDSNTGSIGGTEWLSTTFLNGFLDIMDF